MVNLFSTISGFEEGQNLAQLRMDALHQSFCPRKELGFVLGIAEAEAAHLRSGVCGKGNKARHTSMLMTPKMLLVQLSSGCILRSILRFHHSAVKHSRQGDVYSGNAR